MTMYRTRALITASTIAATFALSGCVWTAQTKQAEDQPEFTDLPHMEVVLDVERGWRGILTRRRAYDDVSEQQGLAPQRVAILSKLAGIRGFSMSPDGQRIVYAAAFPAEGEKLEDALRRGHIGQPAFAITRSNLQGIRLTGGGIEQITVDDFYDIEPAFSHDGEWILFASNRRRLDRADLIRIRGVGRIGGIQNVYIDVQDNWILSPSQGANGTIAFGLVPSRARREGGQAPQIWTVGGPNRFPTQVTTGEQPRISPDGGKIAFIRHGNLWMGNSDGSDEIQLTTDADEITRRYYESLTSRAERDHFNDQERNQTFFPYSYPSWSPDGQFILYTSMHGSGPVRPDENIWIMSVDGRVQEQLTTNYSADRIPLMSPDGESIYFLSNRGRQWAIWRIPSPPFVTRSAALGNAGR